MRLLLAEDDRDLSRALSALLARSNYAVDPVYDGQDALDYALEGGYDGIILDVMMPKLDGVTVIRKIREAGLSTPCLMLTAKDQLQDRIEGLDAGADDYLAKPFATGELLARVRALLRRKGEFSPDVVRFGDLTLDRATFQLSVGDRSARLGGKAFQMMEMLISSPHRVISVSQFMERVWGWDAEAEVNVVWVNISFLRKKLQELGAHVEIRATRGAGYSLEELP